MTFYVENETQMVFDFNIQTLVENVMEEVLTTENCPYEAQINLLITDNEGICEYNKEYRSINKATDVLSFPMIAFENEADFSVVEEHEVDFFDPDSGELILGDIIISAEKVKGQAVDFNHSEKREFAFLIAHSILHLCGYDHMEEQEAKVMEEKQETVLMKMGITRN